MRQRDREKAKFIILTLGKAYEHRDTWEGFQSGQEAEERIERKILDHCLYWGFWGRPRQSR
jgi:hypothetical protein